jgi:hypothetical protein
MSYSHGMCDSRIYSIWEGVKGRCLNPNSPVYSYYGGRGIGFYEEWKEFIPFYEWSLHSGYDDSLTLDRIDTNGNYCPDNCRWATKIEQSRNQRKTIFIAHNGEMKPLTEWCELLGLKPSTVHERIRKGFPEELLLLPPWELKKPQYKSVKRHEKTKKDYKRKDEEHVS